jgi:heat shock protein HslJ
MKKMPYWSIFLALVWLVSACSSPTQAPTQESTPQFEKAAQEETSAGASAPGITNLLWRWVGLVESGERNPELIPDPLHYTLSFSPRGTFEIVSDCNWANGSYNMEGENLDITIETQTEVSCDPTSLSDQYTGLIEEVESYTLEGAQLNLVTNGGASTMLFTSLGPLVTLPEVPEGVPTAYVVEPLSIRGGPGPDYPSYGVVATGQTAEVTGVSEDGDWWVIAVPAEVSPDRQGWVNANYVQVTGARDVPVIPNP